VGAWRWHRTIDRSKTKFRASINTSFKEENNRLFKSATSLQFHSPTGLQMALSVGRQVCGEVYYVSSGVELGGTKYNIYK